VYLTDIICALQGSLVLDGSYVNRLQERQDQEDTLICKINPEEWNKAMRLIPESSARFIYDNEEKFSLAFMADLLNTSVFSKEKYFNLYAEQMSYKTSAFGGNVDGTEN
jgi:hypothetical protein